MAANVAKANDANADGEVVWSWRPKAGAKFREDAQAHRAGNGDNKVWLTGESAE